MTDLEISKALALAIGWKPKSIDTHGTDSLWCYTGYKWHRFDYKEWNVIGPIAEKYGLEVDFHLCGAMSHTSYIWYYRDTVQEAIAACVIESKK